MAEEAEVVDGTEVEEVDLEEVEVEDVEEEVVREFHFAIFKDTPDLGPSSGPSRTNCLASIKMHRALACR